MSGLKPLLQIKDLRIAFDPKKEIVHGVSLEVERGSFACLVGESGSGKTQTSLSIAQLSRGARYSGQILWQETTKAVDLLALQGDQIRKYRGKKIAFVFQDPASSLNPVVKIGTQLNEVFLLDRPLSGAEVKREAIKLLSKVHFPDPERVYSSFAHELSGGMRQRVMIAMAIARGPELLIADEPTTALDAVLEKEILSLMRELHGLMGLTLLWITHDMALVADLADRVDVMREGRIVETMLRGKRGLEPKDPYTKALFAASLWKGPPKSLIEVSDV